MSLCESVRRIQPDCRACRGRDRVGARPLRAVGPGTCAACGGTGVEPPTAAGYALSALALWAAWSIGGLVWAAGWIEGRCRR